MYGWWAICALGLFLGSRSPAADTAQLRRAMPPCGLTAYSSSMLPSKGRLAPRLTAVSSTLISYMTLVVPESGAHVPKGNQQPQRLRIIEGQKSGSSANIMVPLAWHIRCTDAGVPVNKGRKAVSLQWFSQAYARRSMHGAGVVHFFGDPHTRALISPAL